LSKKQATIIAEKRRADREAEEAAEAAATGVKSPKRRIANRAAEANSVAFNRAIARVDWMKEPWLLLNAPPQSINSLDTTHNVLGSVYSVGPTQVGVESLTEQYARRCVVSESPESTVLLASGAEAARCLPVQLLSFCVLPVPSESSSYSPSSY
jgi:hypothetical protein